MMTSCMTEINNLRKNFLRYLVSPPAHPPATPAVLLDADEVIRERNQLLAKRSMKASSWLKMLVNMPEKDPRRFQALRRELDKAARWMRYTMEDCPEDRSVYVPRSLLWFCSIGYNRRGRRLLVLVSVRVRQ